MGSRRDIDAQIGLRAQSARKAKGFSQEELGQRLGMSKNSYGQYERGEHPFTAEHLVKLSAVLGHSVGYFLGLKSELTPDEDRLLTLHRQARAKGLGDLFMAVAKAVAEAKVKPVPSSPASQPNDGEGQVGPAD